jgi:hypothetical protein
MADGAKPQGESVAALGSIEGLSRVWDHFRGGGAAVCPRRDASMALAVDAAANAYRFVCTDCGLASPWFESTSEGMKLRGGLESVAPPLPEE